MAKKQAEGICHICGARGPLTFEHIPPAAAFNGRRAIIVDGEQAIYLGPGDTPRGRYQQRGAGRHTLCARCNNDTGAWYARDFVEWCYQGMDVLVRSEGRPKLVYMHYIYPLRVLKQIVTMMFSVNGPDFRLAHQELVRFVLHRDARYLPPGYRFYAYYSAEGGGRAIGTAGLLNVSTGRMSIMSEVNHPPFGYVMTIDSAPPDERLFDITHFARYAYDDWVVMPLHLPVLPTHLAFPGDYRTMEQIDRDYAEALAFERGRRAGVPLMLPTG